MAIVELEQRVGFFCVHKLHRDVQETEAEASRRIHGHDYQATACVRREVGANGMVMDQAHLRDAIRSVVEHLEGREVSDVGGLGPATAENIAIHLWRSLEKQIDGLSWVAVGREQHGDRVVYRGE